MRLKARILIEATCRNANPISLLELAPLAKSKEDFECLLDVVARRCMRSRLQDIEIALDRADQLDKIGAMLKLAIKIGQLFGSGPGGDGQRAMLVLEIIKINPSSSILDRPYCYVNSEPGFSIIAGRWRVILDAGKDCSVEILSNAAGFFFFNNPGESKRLYQMCARKEPKENRWKDRLRSVIEFQERRSKIRGSGLFDE